MAIHQAESVLSKQEVDRLFEKAQALATGQYVPLSLLNIPAEECASISMYNIGRTNASSKVHFIGTKGLDSCLGIAVYNPRTRETAIAHLDFGDVSFAKARKWMRSMFRSVNGNENDPLEIHLIGANNSYIERNFNNMPPYVTEHFASEDTYRRAMAGFIYEIAQHPGTALKTFDVDSKPHPIGFGLDSRNGQLIALSGLSASPWSSGEQGKTPAFYPQAGKWQHYGDFPDDLSNRHITRGNFCFDGTLQKYQGRSLG